MITVGPTNFIPNPSFVSKNDRVKGLNSCKHIELGMYMVLWTAV